MGQSKGPMAGPLAHTPGPHSQQPPTMGSVVVEVEVLLEVEVLVVVVELVDVLVVVEVDVLDVVETVGAVVLVTVVLEVLDDVVVGTLQLICIERSVVRLTLPPIEPIPKSIDGSTSAVMTAA